jgi:transcriptional regulator
MYIPDAFAEPDVGRARALIAAYPFGTLIVPRADAPPEIAHIPFLLDYGPAPYGTLRAHVARANPIASLLARGGVPIVAMFLGPHAYVTPRWYVAPAEQVPTWNYAAVHAHGVARRAHDREETLKTVTDLSVCFEQGAEAPWTVATANETRVNALLRGIVAFSVKIDRLEAKLKLSQNRAKEDRAGVVAGLRARHGPEDEAVAKMMEAEEAKLSGR